MRIDEQPYFNTNAGVDHSVSCKIDSSKLTTKIIKALYNDVMRGVSGCRDGAGSHCRLVFSNFNANIEKLD